MTANDNSPREGQEYNGPGAVSRLGESRKQLRIAVEQIDDSGHVEDLERAEGWIADVENRIRHASDEP